MISPLYWFTGGSSYEQGTPSSSPMSPLKFTPLDPPFIRNLQYSPSSYQAHFSISCLLIISSRWRARRQSIRELRQHSDDTYKEYLKLCAQDKQLRQSQPPQYEDCIRGSGVSISSSQTRDSQNQFSSSRGTSFMGSPANNSRPSMLFEERSETTSMNSR